MKAKQIYDILVSIHSSLEAHVVTWSKIAVVLAKKYPKYKTELNQAFNNYINKQNELIKELEKLIKKYRPIQQIDSFVDLDGDSRKKYTYLFDGKEWELYPLLKELRKIYKDIYIYSNVYYWWNRKTKEIDIDYIIAGRALEYTIYSLSEWTVRPIDESSNIFENGNNNDQSNDRLPF